MAAGEDSGSDDTSAVGAETVAPLMADNFVERKRVLLDDDGQEHCLNEKKRILSKKEGVCFYLEVYTVEDR